MVLAALTCIVYKLGKGKPSFGALWPGRSPSAPLTPPGPWGLPVIGHLLHLGRRPHYTLTELRATYGDVYIIKMGSWPTVVLNGIDTVRDALVRKTDDFSGRPDFYSFKFLANGNTMGFSDYGPRWKLHRKIAQNALSLCVKKREIPIERSILNEVDTLVKNLTALNGETPLNPHTEIYLSVGSIICDLCFGKRYQRDDPDFLQLIKMNDDFMSFVAAGNPIDIMPWMRHISQRSFRRFLSILKTMDEWCLRKRKEHLMTYDPSHIRDITDAFIKATSYHDKKQRDSLGLTDEHILTTVQEMIGAGFDTISTTLEWAILYLVTNPELQRRVQLEIRDVIGNDRLPSVADQSNLPLVEAFILETMRHACIFPFALPHSTTIDTSINGYHIPSKTLVFVNLWSVCRDPKKFHDPNVFDPQRFLKRAGAHSECDFVIDKSVVENFLPFGAGRRRCPGEILAKSELFLFFASLVQKCSFKPIPGRPYKIESKYGLTLKPTDYEVLIEKRI